LDRIVELIALKGNCEFALEYDGREWRAAMGNRDRTVSLAEALQYDDDAAEHMVRAATPQAAIEALIAAVTAR
jgi:hypothetical protein